MLLNPFILFSGGDGVLGWTSPVTVAHMSLSSAHKTYSIAVPGEGTASGMEKSALARTTDAQFELELVHSGVGGGWKFGVCTEDASGNPGYDMNSIAWSNTGYINQNGGTVLVGSTYVTSDVLMARVRPSTGEVWLGKNGDWENGGDPVGSLPPGAACVYAGFDIYNYGSDFTQIGKGRWTVDKLQFPLEDGFTAWEPDVALGHRYWRVSTSEGSYKSVNQLEFRHTLSGSTDIDQTNTGGTAIASTYYVPEDLNPGNAFDGSFAEPRWASNSYGDPQWIGYDFGSPISIVEVALSGAGYAQSIGTFNVDYSDDGAAWTSVATGLTNTGTPSAFGVHVL